MTDDANQAARRRRHFNPTRNPEGGRKITSPNQPRTLANSARKKPRKTGPRSIGRAAKPADRDELLLILSERAREGNVAAVKALLDELRRDASDEEATGSTLDALDNVVPITGS